MHVLRVVLLLSLVFTLTNAAHVTPSNPARWGTVTVSFRGENTSELATPNPFTDYRLVVVFTHVGSGAQYQVPGFFAADARAAHTSASAGHVWQVRFTPSRTGPWRYHASFKTAPFVAVSTNMSDGSSTQFDGENGSFRVSNGFVSPPDLRAKGRMQYVGQRYYRYANGQYKLKLGTNTPENFLGYAGFDGEDGRLSYTPHLSDWRQGDPVWGSDARGKEIIGAINYLASMGVNSLFAILMTVKGDSLGQVHPWLNQETRMRFDVSRLEQWQLVFDHAERKGLSLNLAFLETENEALFEHESGQSKSNGFANTRKLFYREMVARFSHNLGFTMTLGEENGWSEEKLHGGGHPWGVGNTLAQRQAFTKYIRNIDPYDSPIALHTFPSLKEEIYGPMLGPNSGVRTEGASLQMARKWSTYRETEEWIARSTKAGLPWVVTADEIGSDGPNSTGGVPIDSHGPPNMSFRAVLCWGNILAGGAGVEVFTATKDQSLNDFREFETTWSEFSRPIQLFEQHNIPFWAMTNQRAIVRPKVARNSNQWYYALGKPGDVYVIYNSGQVELVMDLSKYDGRFLVRWFNPRKGHSTNLQKGSLDGISAGKPDTGLGAPPADPGLDWAVVVSRTLPLSNTMQRLAPLSPRDLIPGSLLRGVGEPHWENELER